MAQVTRPAPDETSGGGSGAQMNSTHSGGRITVPAGWGAQYRGSGRPRPKADPEATTIRPLVADDDPLGIYRPARPGTSVPPIDRHHQSTARPASPSHPSSSASPVEPWAPARTASAAVPPADDAADSAPADVAGSATAGSPAEVVRKAAGTAKEKSRGLGLHGSELIAGACASALATGVTSGLGVGGTVFGSAMTSIVIAIAGAVFVKLFSKGRRQADRGKQRGIWARTAGIGLALTIITGVIGAIFLSKEVGGSLSQQLVNVTSSGYQIREMWGQAWPYLKQAWEAAVR